MDQDAVAVGEPGKFERQCGRNERGGDARKCGGRDSGRRGHHQFGLCYHLGRECTEGHADHPVADRDVRDIRASADDPTAQFATEFPRLERAHRAQHVAEVETGRLDGDPYLVRLQGSFRDRLRAQRVERSFRIRREPPPALDRERHPRHCGTGSDQARDPASVAPPSDVVLAVGHKHFAHEHGEVRWTLGVYIDHPWNQLRRFACQHLAEPPKHRARPVSRVFRGRGPAHRA